MKADHPSNHGRLRASLGVSPTACTVSLVGRLDATSAPVLRAAMEGALALGFRQVLVDFGGVWSAEPLVGLCALVEAGRRARVAGVQLHAAHLPDELRDSLLSTYLQQGPVGGASGSLIALDDVAREIAEKELASS